MVVVVVVVVVVVELVLLLLVVVVVAPVNEDAAAVLLMTYVVADVEVVGRDAERALLSVFVVAVATGFVSVGKAQLFPFSSTPPLRVSNSPRIRICVICFFIIKCNNYKGFANIRENSHNWINR